MADPKEPKEQPEGEELEEDIVTPWEVESKSEKGIDYEKLIGKMEYTMSTEFQSVVAYLAWLLLFPWLVFTI